MNIFIAETIEEIEFIISKTKNIKNFKVLPLDLEVLAYCKKNVIQSINLINLLTNDQQKQILFYSKKLINSLIIEKSLPLSLKKILFDFVRKRFFSAAFLNICLEAIKLNNKNDRIYISGWTSRFESSDKKLYLNSKIILEFYPKQLVINLSNKIKTKNYFNDLYNYEISDLSSLKKKTVLFTSLGYNLGRIIKIFILKKYKVLIFNENKISLFKKIIFKILGVKFLYFSQKEKIKSYNISIKKINFIFNKKNYSRYLNNEIQVFLEKFKNLSLKCKAIDKFISNNKIDYIISVMSRNYQGYFAESAFGTSTKSICISHGTVTESFNKYDKIYKDIIKEAVFDGKFNYFAVQSKIANSVKKLRFGRKLITGNLIFSENQGNNILKKKNHILYAVTYKSFSNLQIYGVELYSEFYNNLEFLNKFSSQHKIKIIVHLHPNISLNTIKLLEGIFLNLIFSQGNIKKSLKNAFVTLSFSSTAIEDSIFSNIPVVLFDRWNRYIHCKSEHNLKKLNQPIYYVNNENKLLSAIKIISQSNQINFSKIRFKNNLKRNITNFFDKIKI